MKKFMYLIFDVLAVAVIGILFFGNILMRNIDIIAHAEEVTQVTDEVTQVTESEPIDISGNGIYSAFIDYLKTQYGEEYESVYNQILAHYGSVEAWVQSFIDENDVPDVVSSSWAKINNWVKTYSIIWVPSVMGVFLLSVGVYFWRKDKATKMQIAEIKENNEELKDILIQIGTALNENTKMTIVMAKGVKETLGVAKRTAEMREEISSAIKAVNGDAEE